LIAKQSGDPVMSAYLFLKWVHVTCVGLSATLFVGRGIAASAGFDWREVRPLRIVPHAVDSVLLASAVAMLWLLRLSPLAQSWLIAKLIGLLCYVGLGMVALRFGRTRSVRTAAFVAAMSTLAYIVSVALTRDPRGFLAMLP